MENARETFVVSVDTFNSLNTPLKYNKNNVTRQEVVDSI